MKNVLTTIVFAAALGLTGPAFADMQSTEKKQHQSQAEQQAKKAAGHAKKAKHGQKVKHGEKKLKHEGKQEEKATKKK